MDNAYLHHVSVPTKDVAHATTFYTDVLGFKKLARPDFPLLVHGCNSDRPRFM